MIKNWYVGGDTHGKSILDSIDTCPGDKSENALIILGDAGLNFYLNKTDKRLKQSVQETGINLYLVRGNHEQRPELLGAHKEYDAETDGVVYIEDDYPNIKYFIDGNIYTLTEHKYKTLVVGGAYSVDKWYRLNGQDPNTTAWTGWFKDEQLTQEEMDNILQGARYYDYDLVLTHTCPFDWQPTDLFLRGLDQSTVDNTMEKWMLKLRDSISYNVWLFGHFHDDRLVRPHVEMFYHDIDNLEDIMSRWANYDKDGSIEWWLTKDPNFYI